MERVGLLVAGLLLVLLSGWYLLGWVRATWLRLVLRSVLLALTLSPSVLIGHGVFPYPAIFVMMAPGHFWTGLVPMLVIGTLCLIVLLSIPALRHAQSPPIRDFGASLGVGAYVKVPLIALMCGMALFGAYEIIRKIPLLWGVAILAQFLVGYFVCRAVARQQPDKFWLWPLLFALFAAGLGAMKLMVLGVALGGSLQGADKMRASHALLAGCGLVIGTMFGFVTLKAAASLHAPHVEVAGGVVGNGLLMLVFYIILIINIYLFYKGSPEAAGKA